MPTIHIRQLPTITYNVDTHGNFFHVSDNYGKNLARLAIPIIILHGWTHYKIKPLPPTAHGWCSKHTRSLSVLLEWQHRTVATHDGHSQAYRVVWKVPTDAINRLLLIMKCQGVELLKRKEYQRSQRLPGRRSPQRLLEYGDTCTQGKTSLVHEFKTANKFSKFCPIGLIPLLISWQYT